MESGVYTRLGGHPCDIGVLVVGEYFGSTVGVSAAALVSANGDIIVCAESSLAERIHPRLVRGSHVSGTAGIYIGLVVSEHLARVRRRLSLSA